MSDKIFSINASEIIYYNFWVQAKDEDEAEQLVEKFHEMQKTDGFMQDSECFQIEDVTDLENKVDVPKWQKVIKKEDIKYIR